MKCLGCVTSFKEGQKLIMEGLHIEYKNYNIPIKEEKSMKILLKTVLSFLNSKGGTIYIGVEDSKGEVKGVQLYQKQKLQFEIFLKRLLTNVTPRVSMDEQSLIKLQFVPVISKNANQNKYVIKIVVRQGDSSTIYCYVHKIVLQDENKQFQEHQILYGYLRHNMGGVEQCKGLNLLKEIRNKALKPIDISQTFHLNCNPDPIVVEDTLSLVNIEGILPNQAKQIQNLFQQYLMMLKVNFSSCFKEQKQVLMIKFTNIQQFEKVKENIRQNMQILNVTFEKYQFGQMQEYQRQVILKKSNKDALNNKKQNKVNELSKNKNYIKDKSSKKYQKQSAKMNEQHQQKFNAHNFEQKKNKKPFKQPKDKEVSNKNVKKQQYYSKKFGITITFLQKQKMQDLIKFIDRIAKIKNKKYCRYVNSLQIFLRNYPQKQNLLLSLCQHVNELKRFSSNQKSFIAGDNIGSISIINYNYHLQDELMDYIINFCQQDIMQAVVTEQKFRCCQFVIHKSKVCHWLDQLLEDKILKQRFSIPGSQKGTKPPMNIRLQIQQYLIY